MTALSSPLRRLDRLLSDNLLGFFALASLFLALAPAVFALGPDGHRLVSQAEIAILGLFALEYLVALAVAPDRKAFARNGWRILDAVIIATGLLALLPPAHELLRNSPALRLIRFARLALFGTRTGTAMAGATGAVEQAAAAVPQALQAWALVDEPDPAFAAADWEEALKRMQSSREDWLILSGVDEAGMERIAQALDVPVSTLYARFRNAPFPRIERMERYTTLFLWYPALPDQADGDIPLIARCPVLLIGSMHNVVTLAGEAHDLPEVLRIAEQDPAMPPLMRTTAAFFKAVIRRYRRVNDALEAALLRIENNQDQYRDQRFLDDTFRLRAEISRVRGNLKHLGIILTQLATRPIAIQGFEQGPRHAFTALADDAKVLYEGVDDLLSNLGALVDLRLNLSSFQMNKVMRLLAILTALTLIPAVTGGLLGMNLAGNPWPPSLLQVSYGLAFGMASCLYLFAIKGWLR